MIADIRFWEQKASEGHYAILTLTYGTQKC
mgnify:CR=1 FL=1